MKSGLESSLTHRLWVDSDFLFWIVPKSGIGSLEKQPQATAANCLLELRYKKNAACRHTGVNGCLALPKVPLFMEAEFGTISSITTLTYQCIVLWSGGACVQQICGVLCRPWGGGLAEGVHCTEYFVDFTGLDTG